MDGKQRPNWQNVLVSLRKIIRATDLHSKKLAKEYGLTIPQLVVLKAVDDLKKVTIGTISNHVSLSQATVTTILNRLEERNLIIRNRSEVDRRIVYLNLTSEGLRIIEKSPPLLHEKFISNFEKLEQDKQTHIISALNEVAEMMDAAHLDAAPLLVSDAHATSNPAPTCRPKK